MSSFRIPLVWQMYGHVDVEADTLDDAIEYALVERPSSNAKPRTMICSSSGRMALCHAIMSCRCDTTWPS